MYFVTFEVLYPDHLAWIDTPFSMIIGKCQRGNEKSVHSLLAPLSLRPVVLWLTVVGDTSLLPGASFIAYYQMASEQTASLKELHQDILHPGFAHGLDFVNQPYGFLLDLKKACQVYGGCHHNHISWGLVYGGF